MRVYSLSIHADYLCAHSGVCCTSGWPIPVERRTAAALARLIERGELAVPAGLGDCERPTHPLLVPVEGAPRETPVVAAMRSDRSCAFYERGSGLCAIHRQAGPDLLPVACRQFPRISLLDGRGLFVTVSHHCPTAAALLFRDDCPLEIVKSPPAFPPDFPFDPLDAREALPPLLSPRVLMDLGTYARWEREVVAVLARPDVTPEAAVGAIVRFAEALRCWRPGKRGLAAHFDDALERTALRACSTVRAGGGQDPTQHYELILGAIPEPHRPAVRLDAIARSYDRWVAGDWPSFARPVCRYLAAKAFGTWLSYQGQGLRTIARSLVVALSAVKVNAALECEKAGGPLTRQRLTWAIQQADHMLVHLASREALARALSGAERVAAGLSSDVR